MVAGCLAVMMLALGSIGLLMRRAWLAPGGFGIRDFMLTAILAGVALGAWAIGLVAMMIGASS